jgi:hypothetical protein
MRLYFIDLKENQIKQMPLEKYIKNVKEYSFLISLEGVYKSIKTSDSLTKLTYIDNNAEEVKIDKWRVFIDKSKQTLTNDVWRIPYEYKIAKVHEETYVLREKSELKFIILRNTDTKSIMDFYFTFEGDIENFSFKEDILTFLSEIK